MTIGRPAPQVHFLLYLRFLLPILPVILRTSNARPYGNAVFPDGI